MWENIYANSIITYAYTFIGIPYIWGGKSRLRGLDCSGFVIEVLSAFGILDGELNAQQIYDHFIKEGISKRKFQLNLIFFGNSIKEITHIAIVIDENYMIECGGGDHTTTNLVVAVRQRACVRIRPIHHRKDFVATLLI